MRKEKSNIAANTLSYLGSVLGFDFSLCQKEVTEEELKVIVEPLYEEFKIQYLFGKRYIINNLLILFIPSAILGTIIGLLISIKRKQK